MSSRVLGSVIAKNLHNRLTVAAILSVPGRKPPWLSTWIDSAPRTAQVVAGTSGLRPLSELPIAWSPPDV